MAALTIYLSNETSQIETVSLRPTATVKDLKKLAAQKFKYQENKVILIYQYGEKAGTGTQFQSTQLTKDDDTLSSLNMQNYAFVLVFQDYVEPPNKLFIELVSGKIIEIEYNQNYNSGSIKAEVQRKLPRTGPSYPIDSMQVMFHKHELDANTTLDDYKIPPGSTLTLILKQDSVIRVNVHMAATHQTPQQVVQVSVPYSATIKRLKQQVDQLKSDQWAIIFQGKRLKDDDKLNICKVFDGSTLYAIPSPGDIYQYPKSDDDDSKLAIKSRYPIIISSLSDLQLSTTTIKLTPREFTNTVESVQIRTIKAVSSLKYCHNLYEEAAGYFGCNVNQLHLFDINGEEWEYKKEDDRPVTQRTAVRPVILRAVILK